MIATQGRIGQHGDQVRLDLEHAAGDVKEVFVAFRVLDADFARLQRRQQWSMTRRDADFAQASRREHHPGFARVDLAFCGYDVDVNRCHGLLLYRFRFLDRFFDRADHVERLLGQAVVFAGDDAVEAANGFGERHVLALGSGKRLGD